MLLRNNDVRRDPNNPNWTIPKSYGVWKVKPSGNSTPHRYGNNPIRETELKRHFKEVTRLALYSTRVEAITHAGKLNVNA